MIVQLATSIMENSQNLPPLSQNLNPIDVLRQLSRTQENCCLQISSGSVSYFIYFHQGKLTYATHSVDPFERLERHLRRLSHEITTLNSKVRTEARLYFETESTSNVNYYSDYRAICWLVDQKHLTNRQASKLVNRLTQEIFESYILLETIDSKRLKNPPNLPFFSLIDVENVIRRTQKKLQTWQSLSPQISSSYQRPYFLTNAYAKKRLSQKQQNELGIF